MQVKVGALDEITRLYHGRRQSVRTWSESGGGDSDTDVCSARLYRSDTGY
jgi:hypothetical protein